MSDDDITPLTATGEQVTLNSDAYERLCEQAETDHRHNVSESADKITLTTKVKRGSATRDQDEVKIKVKGNNPAPTADKLARTLDSLDELGVSQRLRETQPGENDE